MPYKTKVDPTLTALWLQREESSAAAREVRLMSLHPDLSAEQARSHLAFAGRAAQAGRALSVYVPGGRNVPPDIPLAPGTVGGTFTAVQIVEFSRGNRTEYRTVTYHTGRELLAPALTAIAKQQAETWVTEGSTDLAGRWEIRSITLAQVYQS